LEVVVPVAIEGDAVIAGMADVLGPGQFDRLAWRVGVDIVATLAVGTSARRALDFARSVARLVGIAHVHAEVGGDAAGAQAEHDQQARGNPEAHGTSPSVGKKTRTLHNFNDPRGSRCHSVACGSEQKKYQLQSRP